MTPLALTVQAFGAFLERQTLDFTALGTASALPDRRAHGCGQDHPARRHLLRTLRRQLRRRAGGRADAQRPRGPGDPHRGGAGLLHRRGPLPHPPHPQTGARPPPRRGHHHREAGRHPVAAGRGRGRGGSAGHRLGECHRPGRGAGGFPERPVPPGHHAAPGPLPGAPGGRGRGARADPEDPVPHGALLPHPGGTEVQGGDHQAGRRGPGYPAPHPAGAGRGGGPGRAGPAPDRPGGADPGIRIPGPGTQDGRAGRARGAPGRAHRPGRPGRPRPRRRRARHPGAAPAGDGPGPRRPGRRPACRRAGGPPGRTRRGAGGPGPDRVSPETRPKAPWTGPGWTIKRPRPACGWKRRGHRSARPWGSRSTG